MVLQNRKAAAFRGCPDTKENRLMKRPKIAGEYKAVRRQLVKASSEDLVCQFENRTRELLLVNCSWLVQHLLELERARAVKATETHAEPKATFDMTETTKTRET